MLNGNPINEMNSLESCNFSELSNLEVDNTNIEKHLLEKLQSNITLYVVNVTNYKATLLGLRNPLLMIINRELLDNLATRINSRNRRK